VSDLKPGDDGQLRCGWCIGNPIYEHYHDFEWGVEQRCGEALFEKLSLESMQAGLSWLIVLNRRAGMREAFGNFKPTHLATLDDQEVASLALDPRIIRNRAKVKAIVSNARVYLEHFETPEAFSEFLWTFQPAPSSVPTSLADVPTNTEASVHMARALKQLGWTFIGPTSAYAFMQSIGMVNDHLLGCLSRRNV
jgi:DNA-3-methyladenine glycosylase I